MSTADFHHITPAELAKALFEALETVADAPGETPWVDRRGDDYEEVVLDGTFDLVELATMVLTGLATGEKTS